MKPLQTQAKTLSAKPSKCPKCSWVCSCSRFGIVYRAPLSRAIKGSIKGPLHVRNPGKIEARCV